VCGRRRPAREGASARGAKGDDHATADAETFLILTMIILLLVANFSAASGTPTLAMIELSLVYSCRRLPDPQPVTRSPLVATPPDRAQVRSVDSALSEQTE